MTRPSATKHDQPQKLLRISDILPELHDALVVAQSDRSRRKGVSPTGELEWITYERAMMLDTTIALLIRHQLPIDADAATKAVTNAESAASGHADYTAKWALGCAEYVTELAAHKAAPPNEVL